MFVECDMLMKEKDIVFLAVHVYNKCYRCSLITSWHYTANSMDMFN